MSKLLVTTAAGRVVKDPRGGAVPDKFWVETDDPFWSRLVAAGDVIETTADTGSAMPVSGAAVASATTPSTAASTTTTTASTASTSSKGTAS